MFEIVNDYNKALKLINKNSYRGQHINYSDDLVGILLKPTHYKYRRLLPVIRFIQIINVKISLWKY